MCELPRGWRQRETEIGISRRVCKDPYVVAKVWKNAHDRKTWCACIQNHGGMGNYGSWPYGINRIKFEFKRRKDGARWAVQQIPAVKALIKEGISEQKRWARRKKRSG